MPKEIKDKPLKGNLEKEIELLTGEAKLRRKSEMLRDSNLPTTYTYKGTQYEILSGPVVKGNMLEVSVKATKGNKEILLDNPLQFVNPPIKVHDGTYRVEKDNDGYDVERLNYKEDPQEAFKEIIHQVTELRSK